MAHCVKSIQIQSFFWFEYRKIQTRKNSVFGHFSRSGTAEGKEPLKDNLQQGFRQQANTSA